MTKTQSDLEDLQAAITTICKIARAIGLDAYGKLQQDAFGSLPPELIARELFPAANVIVKNWKVYDNFVAAGGPQTNLAPLLVPVGLVSINDDVVLGLHGFAFLTEGSNAILAQYQEEPNTPRIAELRDGWIRLIEERRAALEDMGIKYLQTFIPEKLSVIPEFFPSAIDTPTPLFKAIERSIQNHPELSKIYVSAIDIYASAERRTEVYRKIDTHISPYGAFLLYSAIVERLGCPANLHPEFSRTRAAYADIGSRFLGINVFDELMEVDPAAIYPGHRDPVRIEQYNPPDGSHGGKREVWYNPYATSDSTIVVFGNSFFEFVERGQFALSWWFCRHFRYYHFVWSAELIWDHVQSVKPDFVVCQGIERFMTQIPVQ